ncbi:hypothetical protein J4N45_10345 [Vibrio sp. SCSIO 43140]|uniref:hypothetical protein n=1 Tax=Vibrio sp. SCSIO 43140 TaxID=2819100 RepID=UPI002074E7C5|nr:hypothetical protein [Vibrio sp. SCSIO 43140]USD58929.1 hypothetical protein J4N45_10345 [Vibrio sp. SCSIO 43140]
MKQDDLSYFYKPTAIKQISPSSYLLSKLEKETSVALSAQSEIWPSLGEIQLRLVKFFGDAIPADFSNPDYSLLDKTLNDMVEAWDAYYPEHGKEVAFKQVCLVVIKRCTDLYRYMVTADENKVGYEIIWDPLQQTFHEFVSSSRVRKVKIIDQQLDNEQLEGCRQSVILILPKLFARADFHSLGILPYTSEDQSKHRIIELIQTPELVLGA